MLKYENALVTFTEVPDEIALCFNRYGCPFHCDQCFEPWLQRDDLGRELTLSVVKQELEKHSHCSCVCFMGGDGDYSSLAALISSLKQEFPLLKMARYSGSIKMNPLLEPLLDYYKIGPFIPANGPLNKETTNQHFYKKERNSWKDITYRFQQKKE